jgi:hypothetical protein
VTGCNLNRTARETKRARQQTHQFFISRAVYRRRSDSHTQCAIVFTDNLAAGSAHCYTNGEREPAILFGIIDHGVSYQNREP